MKHVISTATIDSKDRKGMYTNTFLHFLLAYQVKQGLRTTYQYIEPTAWQPSSGCKRYRC